MEEPEVGGREGGKGEGTKVALGNVSHTPFAVLPLKRATATVFWRKSVQPPPEHIVQKFINLVDLVQQIALGECTFQKEVPITRKIKLDKVNCQVFCFAPSPFCIIT